jgi:hypothetical protein
VFYRCGFRVGVLSDVSLHWGVLGVIFSYLLKYLNYEVELNVVLESRLLLSYFTSVFVELLMDVTLY